MFVDRFHKLREEAKRINNESLQIVQKVSDPVIKQLIINIHNQIFKQTELLLFVNDSVIAVVEGNLKLINEIVSKLKSVAPSDVIDRISELESVIEQDLSRITELVELLRVIHEEEAENLEKLR